jgi:hypothetical protein
VDADVGYDFRDLVVSGFRLAASYKVHVIFGDDGYGCQFLVIKLELN